VQAKGKNLYLIIQPICLVLAQSQFRIATQRALLGRILIFGELILLLGKKTKQLALQNGRERNHL